MTWAKHGVAIHKTCNLAVDTNYYKIGLVIPSKRTNLRELLLGITSTIEFKLNCTRLAAAMSSPMRIFLVLEPNTLTQL